MADEYAFTLSQKAAESVVEMIQRMPSLLPSVAIHAVAGNEVKLRWLDAPLRTEWPEDATISWDSKELLLSIHCGTRDQRRLLTECLNQVISGSMGKEEGFHEV